MNKMSLLRACNITTGKKDSNAAAKNGKYPFFTCAPEPLRINSFCFDDDVILLAGNNAGGNFHCQRYKGKFDAYQRTYVLTAKEGYYLDFVYYSLLVNLKQYSKKSQGSQTKFLTMKILQEFEIDEISFNEQRNIANRLKSIDSKIKNNFMINAELESMAKTLYDYWFLQFEFPNVEGKPYKSSGGKMIWNEELKRKIPEGWAVENLIETSLCKDIKAGVDYFDTKNYLPTANIDGESIIDGEDITYDSRENRANMQPIKYSVWFAKMKNSIKHLTIPNNSDWFIHKYILSTGFQGLKCNADSLSLVHCIINSSWFENYKDVLSHGATQEGVNNDDLKNIKFAVPTNGVLKNFSKKVLPILEKKFTLIRENQELTSLRDFLLPLLMNGQVTFR